MSFAELLTPQRLQTLAGFGYDRGKRYASQGHVLTCVLDGDVLEGTVLGSELYRVRLIARQRQLVADCTCPIGVRGEMCKHAVALALHHLAAGDRTEPARRVELTGFATRAELEAWAAEHRVEHELVISAEAIATDLVTVPVALHYVLSRWPLRELGSHADARPHLQSPAMQQDVVAAVRRRLEAAAASVHAARAAESELPRPSDPAFAGLHGRLLALRRELRTAAEPRTLEHVRGTLRFDVEDIAFVWSEPIRVWRNTAMFAFVPVVTKLSFAARPQLDCACKAPACTHGIALVDAALALLADPARHDEAARIAGEIERPPWRRALAVLADAEAAPKPAREIQVWWHVETELGALTATPVVKRRLKNGGWSAGARLAPGRLLDEYRKELDERDIVVADHLLTWTRQLRATYPVRAFAALVGHPYVATEAGDPITIRRAALGFNAHPVGEMIRLEPAVEGARFSPRLLAPLLETFTPGEPLVVIEPEHARCLLIDVSDDARRLWGALTKHGDTFPPESHDELLARLAVLDRKLPLSVPASIMGDRLDEAPVIVMRLRLVHDGIELEAFVRPAPGAPLYPPNGGPRDIMIARNGTRGYVRRDLASEPARLAAALARLPLDGIEEGPPRCFTITDGDRALAVVAVLQDPPPGIEAEWVDDKRVRLLSSPSKAIRVQIDHQRDWFNIVGDVAHEAGRIELAVVLDAVRRQRRFVRAGEDSWLELTEALRERLAGLAERVFAGRRGDGGTLEVSPAAAEHVRALRDAGEHVSTPPAWELVTDRMLAAQKLRPRPPATLQAQLRPYQVEGHAWLTRLAAWGVGGCLADDMGLGKTVQAIAMLLDRAKLGPAIVLAPTSVSLNWVDEIRKFGPSLRPVVYGEASDRIATLAGLGKRDILIVSYGLLARDADRLANVAFATLVADEAQMVKNPQTTRAKAARALRAEFRVALSGTPLENHLGELWSLFAVVAPGLLGTWEQFRTQFALPIERDRDERARTALTRLLKPFLLRRTKAEVAPELPPRAEILVPIAMSAAEQQLYDDARLAAVAMLTRENKKLREEQRRFKVLAALTRLRLLASHPRLYDPESPVESSKLQRLLELVDELRSEGHRALVFSQFTSHLAIVRTALERAGFTLLYLDGQTPAADRADRIRRFQGGEGDVFLISLKAGGTGINLTAADYVIHLDPWWNPAVEDQATDRAHRIGQDKPVTVYRLITRGTVEDKILEVHAHKRALVAGVLDGSDAAARLTTRELLELLGASPQTD